MESAFEEKYLRVEETQWWCKARREAVMQIAAQSRPDRSARILEVGCSGGWLVRDLKAAGYDEITGIDISEAAIHAARQRQSSRFAVMDGARLAFANASFDLVIASDVLEHIEDEAEALREWRRVLKKTGKLLVFVPAFQFLWSSHDVANHHYRRYSAAELRPLLEQSGFVVQRLSYWNALLTLPGFALSLLRRAFPASDKPKATGGLVQPIRPVNESLFRLISMENSMLRVMDLPFGTSVFAVATAS